MELSELENAIKAIVDTSELTSLTFNKILEKLLKQFASHQSDIEKHKDSLRRFVKFYIAEKAKENQPADQNEEQPTTEKKSEDNTANNETETSKEATDENKKDESNASEKKTKKQPKKSKPKEKKENEDDVSLVSSANTEAQKLMLDAYRMGAVGGSRTRSGSTPKRKPISKKRKRDEDEDEGKSSKKEGNDEDEESKPPKKKRRENAFSKPQVLSAALSEFLGEEKLSRPEVVKRLHSYFKEKALQNPKDKRKILFDEKLQKVFKVKSTDYFKLNKLISKHVKPEEETI